MYLKQDVTKKQIEIDELKTQITLMGEADKVIMDFKRQIEEKNKALLA